MFVVSLISTDDSTEGYGCGKHRLHLRNLHPHTVLIHLCILEDRQTSLYLAKLEEALQVFVRIFLSVKGDTFSYCNEWILLRRDSIVRRRVGALVD